MMRRLLAAGLVLALAAPAVRADGSLSVGDPAPKLKVKEFVKGDPVKELEKGKVYVVEFWATWCGPCRTSIPHLTELAKKHKDVTFIGVSVWERDQDKVKPFVEEMGDKMDYRVAMDAVPEGKKADDGPMAKHWMSAADQNGIPTAFIINKDRQIAWIGHPMRMEKPLDQIVAGTWDVKAEAARVKEEKAQAKKVQELTAQVIRGVRSGDVKDALAAADEFVKDHPKAKMMLGQQLNEVAWSLVDPDRVKGRKPPAKQTQAAVDVAAKAAEYTNNDPGILDTLACAYYLNGDADKAVEVQEKAVKARPDDMDMKQHLDLFKKGKDKKDDK